MAKTDLPRVAASQSFTEDEVNAIDAIITTILRGGDAKILARSPAARSFMQKVKRMAARVAEVKRIRAEAERQPRRVGTPVSGTEAPEESSE